MFNLFTYGTLSICAVMQLVCGKTFSRRFGRVDGHACFLLKGKVYPGMVASEGGIVRGVLHFGVDSVSMRRLDLFEDADYERQSLRVTGDDGQVYGAQAYVLRPGCESLLSGEAWNEAHFVKIHLAAYLSGELPLE